MSLSRKERIGAWVLGSMCVAMVIAAFAWRDMQGEAEPLLPDVEIMERDDASLQHDEEGEATEHSRKDKSRKSTKKDSHSSKRKSDESRKSDKRSKPAKEPAPKSDNRSGYDPFSPIDTK